MAVFTVRQQFRALLGQRLRPQLVQCYDDMHLQGPYQYSATDAGQRALRNCCLGYLLAVAPGDTIAPSLLELGTQQYRNSNNMSDTMAALSAVVNADLHAGTDLLADFYAQWQHDPLVVDKWLILQAGCTLPGTLERVRTLTTHPAFTYKNPNKVRSLIATFCATNHCQFHADDGSAYAFLADQVLLLDSLNPQIASRMITPLTQWRRYDALRQQLMHRQLERIADQPKLSGDLREIVEKTMH
jgi:aminopeptidase N